MQSGHKPADLLTIAVVGSTAKGRSTMPALTEHFDQAQGSQEMTGTSTTRAAWIAAIFAMAATVVGLLAWLWPRACS